MDLEGVRKMIGGVSYASQLAPTEPPLITVVAMPKSGKSSLVPTLYDWPDEGDRPLVIAFDKTGPDACAQLGYAVPFVKVADLPGKDIFAKSEACISNLEDVYITKGKRPYSSIVVDCGSTQAASYWTATSGTSNSQQRYGIVLDRCVDFMDRLRELGVPIIYLSWLAEPWLEERGSKSNNTYQAIKHPGGLHIRGSFKEQLAGKSMMILLLDKTKPAPAVKDRDADGFKRVFHTREYNDVMCGGRYKLPEPMTANLGVVLSMIMGMMPNPALEGLTLKR